MSIDAGAQVVIILLVCGPCVVIVNLLGQVCTLGRALCTKKTLPDFHEWCCDAAKPEGPLTTRQPAEYKGCRVTRRHFKKSGRVSFVRGALPK